MATLCVAVMLIVLVRMSSGRQTPPSYYVVFVVASFVLALARFEGVLVALILVVAFVSTKIDFPTRRQQFILRLAAVFSPISGFLLWIGSFGDFPVTDISLGLVVGVLVSAGLLLVLFTSFSAILKKIVLSPQARYWSSVVSYF